jgi:hypothetical protein
MSDSIKKYHEMVEEGKFNPPKGETYIYESPDGGKTVTSRPFRDGVVEHPTTELKKKAYRLLCDYDEDVIRMAMKIIDIGG